MYVLIVMIGMKYVEVTQKTIRPIFDFDFPCNVCKLYGSMNDAKQLERHLQVHVHYSDRWKR